MNQTQKHSDTTLTTTTALTYSLKVTILAAQLGVKVCHFNGALSPQLTWIYLPTLFELVHTFKRSGLLLQEV